MKAWSSGDRVISVIVKTVFLSMLLFDLWKVCRTNIFTKNKYFFVSFNNDRGLSLDDEIKAYVHRNTIGLVHSSHEVTQLG